MRTSSPRCASMRASATSEPQPSPSAFMCVDSATRRPGTSSRVELLDRRAARLGDGEVVGRAACDIGNGLNSETAPEHSDAVSNITATEELGRRSARRHARADARVRCGRTRSRSPGRSPARRSAASSSSSGSRRSSQPQIRMPRSARPARAASGTARGSSGAVRAGSRRRRRR